MSGTSAEPLKTSPLSVAAVLSDLSSLGVCDTESALALVSAGAGTVRSAETLKYANEHDADLKRAFTLTEIYSSVKRDFAHDQVVSTATSARDEMYKARDDVNRAMNSLPSST
ncbi:MAG: hypothetical protein Q9159_000123 [Coniocarpon cinnabarinum]